MTAVAIIQARLGSSRFPGKVLHELHGEALLGWTLRAARLTPGIDDVIVACPAGDDAIVEWCTVNGVTCHDGDEHDVLGRMLEAAELSGADAILRLTADCPLLDPQVCGEVLMRLRFDDADYASNIEPRSWPDGLDCEAITLEALKRASRSAKAVPDREHVTSYIRRNFHTFRNGNIRCPIGNLKRHRWTIDTEDDLKFLERLIESAYPGERGPVVSYLKLLHALQQDTELSAYSTRGDAGPIPAPSEHAGYRNSNELFDAASRRIPLASQTFSKSWMMYPQQQGPLFISHGRGARAYDVDGNGYVDLVNGLLPVVLGYCDPDVDAAILRQLDRGISFSLAHELEMQVAEKLAQHIPCAEMTRFGKNGSDATTAAVRLARARTGRDRVAVCGYHGWQDWYIGSTLRNKGVPEAVRELTHPFPYNNLSALEQLLDEYPGEFAAVIMEPMNVDEPSGGYLQAVLEMTHRHGALLVFDEIITGFRFSLGGAQALFNVTPDLATFGKAMGNGMPVSAVCGPADLMAEMEEIFFSGTFGGETLSLAASLAVIKKMEQQPIIQKLWKDGEALSAAASKEFETQGLGGVFEFKGSAPWKIISITPQPGSSVDAIATVFRREMLKRGVLVCASHNVSAALTDDDIAQVVRAYSETSQIISDELARGDLDQRLGNSVIRPVFKVR